MKLKKTTYILTVLTIILIGLLSRAVSYVPIYFGDILYGMMMYYIIRLILINSKLTVITVTSVLICYFIELTQLHQSKWLNAVRGTLLGKLILGQGFLFSDIICYTVGILISLLLDIYFFSELGNTMD